MLKPRLDDTEDQMLGGLLGGELLRFILLHAETIIGTVLCLDVFISSMTGVLDPDTGSLKPKSFFVKWGYPGILMHLLANPKMTEVSALVGLLMEFIHEAGPGRVWRWWVYIFFPFWNKFVLWFEWQIWIRLVRNENQSNFST